jgi:hypothetical protein
MSGYEIRPLRPGDEQSLLACFHAAFPGVERTLEEWRWACEQNPAGQRVFVALYEGRVVAQYAALPRRVWIAGGEHVFAEIVDSMAHPEHRAGLARPGLFVATARAFFAAYGGRERDLVHYGWPVPRALRIGQHYLRYEVVRTQCVLVKELGAGSPGSVPPPAGIARIERFDHQARWLWERCAGEFGASAVRDAAYLNWRYADHPRHAYHALGVRDAAAVLRGLAVWRRADWGRPEPVPDLGLVAEWLVPPAEGDVGDALLAALEHEARAAGARALVVLLPEWSPWFARFQERGFLVHPTDYAMVARNFDPRFDVHWLAAHWWYQLGDGDLI